MQTYRHPPLVESPGDRVVESILREIAVRDDILVEAKKRRRLVCRLAMEHEAARRWYYSGSIAHGTHNAPLGDADCGVVLNRLFERFRVFGPDADGVGKGPEEFIQAFAAFIVPELRAAGYPKAEVDLTGNRALRFVFNSAVDFDELGPVDPQVDLILGLTRRDGEGLWIPNRRKAGWDASHPERHTELMTKLDPQSLVVHRAHVNRLGKRAVKRDDAVEGRIQVMCSWNLGALSLAIVLERRALAAALAEFFNGASMAIAQGLTADPAKVSDPIALPDGVSLRMASARLAEMAGIINEARSARSDFAARHALAPLFGVEIDAISQRERRITKHPLNGALRSRDPIAIGTAAGAAVPLKRTVSDGD
jgi:hypothetical protein